MPRGLEVSLPEELQPAVLEPALVVDWLAREEGRDMEDQLTEEEHKYIMDNATTLRLEFMKIVKIDNLSRLRNLTRLFLDNNFIEAISGLDTLTGLEWLDLSFNKISKIENLEKLIKLKVLALFSNQIVEVEALESLQELEVLRLGNNKINSKKVVIYLRQLPKLRTLSLKGNPVTRFKEFDGYVAAFLPKLMYYEFKMVDGQLRKLHTEKNQGEIFKVLGREQREEMRLTELREKAATEKMEKAAFINCLKGEDLLEMMFTVHTEKEELLLKMPQARETQEGFRTEFLGILSKLYHLGLAELKQREAERVDIEVGINKAKKEVEEEGVQIIDAFVREKEAVFLTLSDFAEQYLDLDPEAITEAQANAVDSLQQEYTMMVRHLWEQLMGTEIVLVNSIEGMIEEYERRLGSMTTGFLEGTGRLLQRARDTETMYFQHLLDQAEGATGVDPDLILDTVALCHDSHQAVLDRQQDHLRVAVSTWREEHFRCLRDTEFQRNRSRVLEVTSHPPSPDPQICHFSDTLRQELEDMEVLPSHGLEAEEGVD